MMNQRLRSFVSWITVPLALALAATGLQAFWPAIYSRATPISQAGGVASDLVDLFLVLPVLVVAAVRARRGSLGALLVWTGVLGFLTYNFAIYAFEVHFNAMFLVYCAVLGLSFYGLIGVREVFDPAAAAKAYPPGAPRTSIAIAFLLLAFLAAVGELKEILAAIQAGHLPASIIETGERTNPIHVLDLCFLLPALVIAAVMLLRRNPVGFALAPGLSVVLILISIEVITIVLLLVRRGLAKDTGPVTTFAAAGVVMTALLVWYLYPKGHGTEETDSRNPLGPA